MKVLRSTGQRLRNLGGWGSGIGGAEVNTGFDSSACDGLIAHHEHTFIRLVYGQR